MPAADAGVRHPFAYALLRVVPRADRGERLNVAIVLYSRRHDFLDMRAHLDGQRLAALDPELDPEPVRARLDALRSVVCGEPEGGALAALEPSERFGWIVAPASTILQPSEVHTGLTADPAQTLERLFATLVR
ncbi:MAG TPA: DUF3037 domain-containing protein [Solirubrobacteraceae bacterium]|nr:DUF3037 domain-containing protein [Solirubrobacteraceae bacterium]